MKQYKTIFRQLVPLLLILVLVIGLSEIFYQNMIQTNTQECWDELFMIRTEVGRQISDRLNTNIKFLTIASDALVMNADLEDEQAVLNYLEDVRAESIFNRIDVIYPDGSILVQSGERVPDGGEKTYQELLANGPHLSMRVADHYTGEQAIHAFSPVYDASGENVAILGATVYCSSLAEIFTSVHYSEETQVFLIDLRDGNFVLDKWHSELLNIDDLEEWPRPEEYEDVDFVSDILAGNTGHVAFTSNVNGQLSYMVYAPVENTDFTLALMLQEDVIFSNVIRLRRTLTLVGVIEVLLLLVFAVWIYVSLRRTMKTENRAQEAELALLHQKEKLLEDRVAAAAKRQEFLGALAVNLPGGYHRCTTDHDFRVTFLSNSFTSITGYTLEQLNQEFGGSYLGIVAPEDREYFLSLAPKLERDGLIHCAYRIRRRDGELRWVQDSTHYVEQDGEQYYQCALMDTTEQIEEVEQAKQLAEASSHAKSTFLFNISHDIRTPMNAIKGYSMIARENANNPELVVDTLRKIEQAGDSLILLMNDVLDISRIERGKEELQLQPMFLSDLWKNIYEMFLADMDAAGIRFQQVGDLPTEQIYGDSLKLTRIIMNMLSNARKFTPAGGTVSLGAQLLSRDEKSCTYRFFVRDTGIGMSPEFQQRAFQQFERERTSTESGVTGSGLGLAIIKMLVELMDGTVELHSQLAKGTEISATLTFQLAEEASRLHSTPIQALDLSGKRVLLVEDNDFNREIAKYILESIHLTVEEAENGALCIDKLLASEPGWYDLILMDLQMPVMDGYRATIEIRNLPDSRRSSIPIIAMTANAFEEDRNKCLEVGMNGHVGKPIDMDALMQELSRIIQ